MTRPLRLPAAGTRDGRTLGLWLIGLVVLTGVGVGAVLGAGATASDASLGSILIAWAPSIAALVAVAIVNGSHGLRSLLRQVARRVRPRWYLLAALGPLALVVAAHALDQLLGGAPRWSAFFDWRAVVAGLGPLIAGSLGEEFGWRGLAQPLLRVRFGALVAAVGVGAIWATWHLWPVLVPGGALDLTDVAQTYVRLISTAVVYAWLYHSTRDGLLVVMVAHAAHNLAIDLMPPSTAAASFVAALYLVAAVLVVRSAGAATLTVRRG